MTVIRSGRPADTDDAAETEFEGEIREFVRRDVAPLRRVQQPEGGEFAANNINSLIQRVAGNSLQEIEMLITELQTLRDFLRTEGERVQREISTYAQLSHAAMRSTKIIGESMAQWKGAVDTSRQHRG
jgi:hypothetical protein